MTALDADRLRTELVTSTGYTALNVVASTGSTNADLIETARTGAADRTVLIAEEQTAGVGRLARTWVSPAGAGLYLSVLLRPAEVPPEATGSLAIVAGLALTDLCDDLGVGATLKWPNDVLVGNGKLAGVLAELVPQRAVVLGIGLNITPLGDVEPGPGGLAATSLAEHGARTTDRTEIAATLLRAFAERERAWRAAHGDLEQAGLLADYRGVCGTLGRTVTVSLPQGETHTGTAVDVDDVGRLTIEDDNGQRTTVLAGDVIHLR
ncbi:biotin--[acetyl-CoA-carboxylase] ligase [Haloechinothrix halophila]|uniref:biotin--[acetyl-CoA-carboxylase] ligase n=1 Tax=Haloechinothrix halophila TaxID=1069073 RepID=UPI0004285A1A|nr:biotin--[acetyl-CoA-carboxylase] ligase [Haloechinothrix halophila]